MRLATQRGTQQFWRTFWRTGSVSTTLVIEDTLLFLRYIISNREFRSIRIESFPFCISIFYSITRAHTFFLFRVDRSRSIREERRKKERAGWWSYCCLLSRLERNESVIGDLPSSLSASTNREKQLLRIDIRIEHDHFERWFASTIKYAFITLPRRGKRLIVSFRFGTQASALTLFPICLYTISQKSS